MELLSKLASIVMKLEYIVGAVGVEVGACVFTTMLLSYKCLTGKNYLTSQFQMV